MMRTFRSLVHAQYAHAHVNASLTTQIAFHTPSGRWHASHSLIPRLSGSGLSWCAAYASSVTITTNCNQVVVSAQHV